MWQAKFDRQRLTRWQAWEVKSVSRFKACWGCNMVVEPHWRQVKLILEFNLLLEVRIEQSKFKNVVNSFFWNWRHLRRETFPFSKVKPVSLEPPWQLNVVFRALFFFSSEKRGTFKINFFVSDSWGSWWCELKRRELEGSGLICQVTVQLEDLSVCFFQVVVVKEETSDGEKKGRPTPMVMRNSTPKKRWNPTPWKRGSSLFDGVGWEKKKKKEIPLEL